MTDHHRMVALLRAINVGGNNLLPMATLRAIAERLGSTDVATYVQSGNLVLTDPRRPDEVGTLLRDAIADEVGLHLAIITRSAGDWARIIADNPFPGAASDGSRLHVAFLPGAVEQRVREFDASSFAPEAVHTAEREIYLHLPDGIGRSKLAAAIVGGKTAVGTVRNWNTVLRIEQLLGA